MSAVEIGSRNSKEMKTVLLMKEEEHEDLPTSALIGVKRLTRPDLAVEVTAVIPPKRAYP